VLKGRVAEQILELEKALESEHASADERFMQRLFRSST